MDRIAYVRRPSASLALPKRVLITRVGDYLYEGQAPIRDKQQFEQQYTPEVLDVPQPNAAQAA